MIPIEPLMAGAAVGVLPRVIEALPKPGEFLGMLRDVIATATSSLAEMSDSPTASDRSFEVQKQQAHGGLLPGIRSGLLGPLSSGSLLQDLNEALGQFRDAIGRMLEENGIDRSEEIRLRTDNFGQARVEGTRADASQIEALFEQNPELRDQLATIQAISGLLDAARRSAEFRQAYDVDPIDAVARFDDFLNDQSAPRPTVVIGTDSFDISFD